MFSQFHNEVPLDPYADDPLICDGEEGDDVGGGERETEDNLPDLQLAGVSEKEDCICNNCPGSYSQEVDKMEQTKCCMRLQGIKTKLEEEGD